MAKTRTRVLIGTAICSTIIVSVLGAEPKATTDVLAAGTFVAAGDIEGLITNLSAGRTKIERVRVFKSGYLIEQYPETAISIERTGGTFSASSQSIVVKGAMSGQSITEDIRFVEVEGTFYVLRDIYLDGEEANVAVGRSTPALLTQDESSSTARLQTNNRPTVASTTATPQINSISGYTDIAGDGINNGVVDMGSCGGSYDGGRAVNQPVNQSVIFNWTLNGANFGNSPGMIQLAGYTFPANSWTQSSITFYPTVPYYLGPLSTTLTVTTSGGAKATYLVGVVPAIETRIFGQCTWYDAYMRLNSGKLPSPNAYPPASLANTGWYTMTGSYTPQVLDQLVWEWSDSSGQHKHTAIVTSVSGPSVTGSTSTWSVTIGEDNATCKNLIVPKTSTYQVQNGAITKQIQTQATTVAPGWFYRSTQ